MSDQNSAIASADNRFLYGGKEYQNHSLAGVNINWYDFGARNYDAQLGRWFNIDPLAEKYQTYSPYNYCLNSPIVFYDPNGMDVWTTSDQETIDAFWGQISSGNLENFHGAMGGWTHISDSKMLAAMGNDGRVTQIGNVLVVGGIRSLVQTSVSSKVGNVSILDFWGDGYNYVSSTNSIEFFFWQNNSQSIIEYSYRSWERTSGYKAKRRFTYLDKFMKSFSISTSSMGALGSTLDYSNKVDKVSRIANILPYNVNIDTGEIVWVNPKNVTFAKWAGFVGIVGDGVSVSYNGYKAFRYGWGLENSLDFTFSLIGSVPVYGDYGALLYTCAKEEVKTIQSNVKKNVNPIRGVYCPGLHMYTY